MARPSAADRARQRALAHLQLEAARAPGEDGAGPLLAMRHQGDDWIARLWFDGDRYGEEPRPGPDRWLRITPGGEVIEEATDNQERVKARRRTGGPTGRPRKHPEGAPRPQRPRITFTPDEEDLVEIERQAAELGVPEAEVVRRLVRERLARR